MILTSRLTFLHLPKSGGIFVGQVLEEVENQYRLWYQKQPLLKRLFLPKPYFENYRYNPVLTDDRMQIHNFLSQVPEKHRKKPVFAMMRHPLDLYVSLYEFRVWQPEETYPMEVLSQLYPRFPDLSFSEFIDFTERFLVKHYLSQRLNLPAERLPGFFSLLFILLFYPNPFPLLQDIAIGKRSVQEFQLPQEVVFLPFEGIRENLHRFLACYYPEELLNLVYDHPVANFGEQRNRRPWQDYFQDRNLLDQVCSRNQLLFHLFPGYKTDLL